MNISALLTCFDVNYSRGGADIVVLSGFASLARADARLSGTVTSLFLHNRREFAGSEMQGVER